MAQYQQQMLQYQAAQTALGNHQAAAAAGQQLAQVAAQAQAAGVHIGGAASGGHSGGAPPQEKPSGPLPKALNVQGFSDQLVNLNGTFHLSPTQTNHDRPVYEKAGTGGSTCVIYFWDLRDGAEQSGWWIAPEVGGAHVWTLNNSNAAYPPLVGWRVPFRGPIDPNVKVTPADPGPTGHLQGQGQQHGQYDRAGTQQYDRQGYNQQASSQENPGRYDRDRQAGGRGDDRRGSDRGGYDNFDRRDDDRRGNADRARYDRGNYDRQGGGNDRQSGFNDRQSGFNDRQLGFNDRQAQGGFNDRQSGFNDRQGQVGYNDRQAPGGMNDRQSGFNDRQGQGGYNDRQSGFNDRQGQVGYNERQAQGMNDRGGNQWAGQQKRAWEEEQQEMQRKRQQVEEEQRQKRIQVEEERRKQEEARKAEMEARQSANEQQQAVVMQQNIEAQIKETDELLEKAKEIYIFEGVEVVGKSLDEINELSRKCSGFELATRSLVDICGKTKRIIDSKILELTRRAQQAQSMGKPWLSVLLDSKACVEGFAATIGTKQQRVQEMLTTCRAVQNMCRTVQREEEDRRRKEELEKQEAMCDTMVTKALHHTVSVEDAFKKAQASADKYAQKEIWKLSDAEISTAVEECGAVYRAVSTLMQEAMTFMDASFGQVQHAQMRSPLGEVRNDLSRLKQRLRGKESICKRYVADLAEYEEVLYEKTAFLVKETLRSKMQETMKEEDTFFESIAVDGVLTWEKFLELFTDVQVNATYLKRVFHHKLIETTGLDFPQFKLLNRVVYRVRVSCPLSEEKVPTSSLRLCTLDVGEGVELCEPPEYVEETKLWRAKAKVLTDPNNTVEGYISVRGTVNSGLSITFLEPFMPYYKCVKDTIMSDIFDLKKFKTVRRLKAGDDCLAVGTPLKEATVGVLRIEVKMLNHTDRGFITLRGNQGSNFLEPRPGPPEKTESQGDEEAPKMSLEQWSHFIVEETGDLIKDFCASASEMQQSELPESADVETLMAFREKFEDKAQKTTDLQAQIKRSADSVLLDLRRFTKGLLCETREKLYKMLDDMKDFRQAAAQFLPAFRDKISTAIYHRKRADVEEERKKAEDERQRNRDEKRVCALQNVKQVEETVIEPLLEKAQNLKAQSKKLLENDGSVAELVENIAITNALIDDVKKMANDGLAKLDELKEQLSDSAMFVFAELATAATQIAQASSQASESENDTKCMGTAKKGRAALEFAQMLKRHMVSSNQSSEEFFKKLAGDSEKMTTELFLGCLESEIGASKYLSEDLQKLALSDFDEIEAKDCKTLSNVFYCCTKAAEMTADADSESKAVRTIEANETLEYLDGPTRSEDKKLTRVRCVALKDKTEGWVTLKADDVVYLKHTTPPKEASS